MHSLRPSRGRILFEVLCVLGMAASCAVAWMQTGATALLAAAGIAALYGLVHLFDLRRPKAAIAAEPQRIELAEEPAEMIVPVVAATDQPTVAEVAEVAEEVEVVAVATARTSGGRRSGGSRKGGGRRTKASKAAVVAEQPLEEEVAAPWPVAEGELLPELPEPTEEFAFAADEPVHSHIAPLFEPEPFARMPRRAFGRRGQL